MLRTKSGLPKHCCWAIDRHGKRRVRFRRRGFTGYLTGTPWSEDFMRQYAAALDGHKALAQNIGAERTVAGSINALIVSYYRSPEWRSLNASTQKVRRNIIERFRTEHGSKPVRLLGRNHIKDIVGGRADTPQAANNLLKVLRVLLAFALEAGIIEHNPAIGVKRYKEGDGIHTWTDVEVETFRKAYPVGTTERLVMELAYYTGQRISDLVRMGWQHVKGDRIAVHQQKTGATLRLRMHPELLRILDALPRDNLTFVVDDNGAPWGASNLSKWFSARCTLAGLPHCSAHGLRKTNSTRIANAGGSSFHVRAFSGHTTSKEVDRYTREADQERLADEALELVLRAEEKNKMAAEIVQPRTRLDKKEG